MAPVQEYRLRPAPADPLGIPAPLTRLRTPQYSVTLSFIAPTFTFLIG
jgi:hypothetical protein